MKTNEAPENYPIQFKDKIDEYLWKEHQIIGGCCSPIENLKYSIAREVAEKIANAVIEEAARWIENNLSKYSELTDEDEYGNKLKELEMNVFYGQAAKDFRNYMKGE